MSTESYLTRRNIYQTLRIDELVKENAGLTLKLQIADIEIGHLKFEVEQSKEGQLALIVKLEESDNEVGRLGMVLKHQVKDMEFIKQAPIRKLE